MFTLKTLHKDAIAHAITKAERYRLLGDASAAESICRDVLNIESDNQQVIVLLLLTITDQFGKGAANNGVSQARELLPALKGEYQRTYYAGIICERWAKAQLRKNSPGGKAIAYEWLREAMDHFAQAEGKHPAGNDDALLRWNSCVRTITSHKLKGEGNDDTDVPSFDH